ncbi:O-methyltransferase, putative [Talaromyces stipitatus ATCC 10500]|uniref:O-methyltransferase, putative n=1 Tax=Talaromyces stipitatus (strain ATCC 10500 / CBS 375.48 / QM 6759 / NRRL 1006) TaxID=441959 RepID=B8MP31_TALSN|nr:O-methyltransferase, putative [Talaromyces stipitatus ATCC 10500]EED14270.1 O-methyltransferase, putative [Talaromyces stipitatus ATCC 10500]
MSTSRIIQLAQLISSQTSIIDSHLQINNLPQPSFDQNGPTEPIQNETPEIQRAKTDVIEAAIELRQLLEGPLKLLLPESNFSPLVAVHRFKIASYVPLDSIISFKVLATKCGVQEHDLKRIIRYTAIHHRVFVEPTKGVVAHTAASRLMVENPVAGHLTGLTFDECWPAHNHAVEAISQQSNRANISGYALANNTPLNTFQYLSQHKERATRFAFAMATTSKASLDALSTHFPWHTLPSNSKIVDVGGSKGHVSLHLARTYPHLRFIVQDLPEVIDGAVDQLPEDDEAVVTCKEKIEFMAHDMFDEQPVKNAEVYLLRYVLHDWGDEYCLEIIRNLIPALKTGAKIVVQDHVLPEPGTMGLLQEMQMRSMDAIMMSLFNSREREADEWEDLFKRADESFGRIIVNRIGENGSSGVISAEWLG